MGLSASQGRLLLLTARRSDLEYRAQQISQKRLVLSQQLEEISLEYENATSNRQMKIDLFLNDGTEDGKTNTQRTSNLTYADLVSGTVCSGIGSDLTGIQGYICTQDREYVSNTPYRLVSVDGAIVVSDKREIPSVSSKSSTTETAATQMADSGKAKYGGNAYETVTKDKDGGETKAYSIVAKGNSPLADVFGNNEDSKDIKIDLKNGLVKVTDDENNSKMYSIETGEVVETDKNLTYNWDEDGKLYKSANDVPKSSTTTASNSKLKLVEGSDGVYSLKDANGVVIQRYIIDETLKRGFSDVNGTTDGPNYLQDCLRNGKYLLQKGGVNENTDEGYKWTNVSWDATTNISDRYYDEDDDAAKAKYDRLQTQIQAQDKKLELELDAIETQRSAITTEVESVEKVINEDIEGTFNAFG